MLCVLFEWTVNSYGGGGKKGGQWHSCLPSQVLHVLLITSVSLLMFSPWCRLTLQPWSPVPVFWPVLLFSCFQLFLSYKRHNISSCNVLRQLLKKQIKFLVVVSQTPFFSFISKQSSCKPGMANNLLLCPETPLPWATMPQLLPASYFGSSHPWLIPVSQSFPLLDLQDLRNTQLELLCLLGARHGFAEFCFRVTSAHSEHKCDPVKLIQIEDFYKNLDGNFMPLCFLWKHHSWAVQLPARSFLKHCQ